MFGGFNLEMKVDVSDDEFSINSGDGTFQEYMERYYGEEVLGLFIEGNEGQDYINNSLRPQLFEQIGKILELEIK
jgi:hypothetical protein